MQKIQSVFREANMEINFFITSFLQKDILWNVVF